MLTQPQEVTNSCILVENGVDQSGENAPVLTSGMIPVVYDECEKLGRKQMSMENGTITIPKTGRMR